MLKELYSKKPLFLIIILTVLLATSMVLFNTILGSKQTFAVDKTIGTPSFIKVGQTYYSHLSSVETQYEFKVLEILEGGWVFAERKGVGKIYININRIETITQKK